MTKKNSSEVTGGRKWLWRALSDVIQKGPRQRSKFPTATSTAQAVYVSFDTVGVRLEKARSGAGQREWGRKGSTTQLKSLPNQAASRQKLPHANYQVVRRCFLVLLRPHPCIHTYEIPCLETSVAQDSIISKFTRGLRELNILNMKSAYTPCHPLTDKRQ
jgi:hypothetical protein